MKKINLYSRVAASMILPGGLLLFTLWASVNAALTRAWGSLALWVIVLVMTGAIAGHVIRCNRIDPGLLVQHDLRRAVRDIKPQEIWLNRDAHLAFTLRKRPGGAVRLTVMDEDLVHEIADTRGYGAWTDITYIIFPEHIGGVLRDDDGRRTFTAESGEIEIMDVGGAGRFDRRLWQAVRTLRTGFLTSQLLTDRAEMREVIGWVAAAERIGSLRDDDETAGG